MVGVSEKMCHAEEFLEIAIIMEVGPTEMATIPCGNSPLPHEGAYLACYHDKLC